MKKINVLIADDHKLFAKLVSTLLQASDDINVVGIANDGEEVLEQIGKKKVDIILLDINMPKLDGMQAMKEIVHDYPKIKIIILSSHNEAWLIQKVLKQGASGYITKSADDEEVLEAIFKVFKGENYCSKESLNSIINSITHQHEEEEPNNLYNQLTVREKEILKLISDELTSGEIADKLNISPRTVETHRKKLLQKLGVKNTVGLIKVAMQADLLEKPQK